jgi:hypothetical protein
VLILPRVCVSYPVIVFVVMDPFIGNRLITGISNRIPRQMLGLTERILASSDSFPFRLVAEDAHPRYEAMSQDSLGDSQELFFQGFRCWKFLPRLFTWKAAGILSGLSDTWKSGHSPAAWVVPSSIVDRGISAGESRATQGDIYTRLYVPGLG